MQVSSVPSRLFVALFLGTACGVTAPALKAAPATKSSVQGQRVVKRVDQLLRGVIQNQNGTPLALQITPGAQVAQGYFSNIHVSGGAAMLKKLHVSEFQMDARNVQVDVPSLWSEGKVRTIKAQTNLRVVISEQDLTQMLASGKHTKDMNLKVKYVGDKMSITGVLNFPFLSGPVSGVGKLRQTSDHNVYLDILSLKLRGYEVPGFIKNQLASHINPVVNYANVPFNPPFRSLKIVGNKAILST